MKLIIVILLVAMILALGCITQNTAPPGTPLDNATPPASNDTNQTDGSAQSCEEYCMSRPHIQCVGNWNISGTYPDCGCVFTCETGNNTQTGPAANDTDNPQSDNDTGNTNNPQGDNNQSAPPGYTITPTDRSVSEMLQDELDGIRDSFYRTHDGSFTEESYTWERIVPLGDGISTAPATDILFDHSAVDSIEASGFIIFENKDDGQKDINGVAICRARQTILDNYTSVFDIEYFPPMVNKHLRDCWMETRDYNMDIEGDWLITYRFGC